MSSTNSFLNPVLADRSYPLFLYRYHVADSMMESAL